MFDEIGGAIHGGMLVAGHRFILPVRPLTALTGKQSLQPGQTYSKPYGVGPDVNLVGAVAQRYYYLSYLSSVAITAGSITCDLVVGSGEGDAKTYMPSAVEVLS